MKEFAGNPSAIKSIEAWFSSWKPGSKALLLVGPPGVGKTTAAITLAKSHGYDLLEMNASDVRDKTRINRILGSASEYGSLVSAGRVILIDEVDGMTSNDRGGTSAIVDVLKNTRFPIILTANDGYASPVRAITPYAVTVKFKKVNPHTIESVLRKIAKTEGIEASEDVLGSIARNSSGDLKSAINDLEALAEGEKRITKKDLDILAPRDRNQDIFQALKVVFKTLSFNDARSAIQNLGVDPEMVKSWIEENIPYEYEGREEIKDAYYWLSKADIFYGRIIKRQSWGLMSYALDFMTSGVALSKTERYIKFTKYQFPSAIKYLSRTKSVRAIRYATAKKIGKRIHASPDEVIKVYLPYFREILKSRKVDPKRFVEHYELSREEFEFLKG